MTITYILAAVILLGLCIFIHELGHLLGGRMVGIKAKIFSIGYGKGVLKKQFGDTTYQLTLIPFGGYCQFYGEDPSEERKGEAYEFLSAHPLKRIVVVIMGPLFNLFFGIALFFSMNLIGYPTETNRISIPDHFKAGEYISPAYSSGLRSGDMIVEINGEEITTFSEIQSNILFSEGKPLNIKISRNNKILDYTVSAKKYSQKSHYTIGVTPHGKSVLIVRTLEGDVASVSGIEKMDEIISVNGKITNSPKDFTEYIRAHNEKEVNCRIIRAGKEMDLTVIPRLREVIAIKKFEDNRFKGDKFNIKTTKLDLIKNAIDNKTLKINDRVIASFKEFQNILKKHKGKKIKLQNQGGTFYGNVSYEAYGFIGVETATSPEMKDVRYGIIDGFIRALTEPYNFVVMNIKGIGMLFSGELNVRENLSGPIRIAKIAGDVAYHRGTQAFILLMAKISIILMVMNLLPIPVVDGSFILFFLYEAIRGKPINEKIMEKIQTVGITLLILLGIFVIFNDLSFLPFFQKIFN